MNRPIVTPPWHLPLIGLIVWFTIVLLAVQSAASDEPAGRPSPRRPENPKSTEARTSVAPAATPSGSTPRLREGLRISDQIGEFQKSDDGVSFHARDGQRVLRVLENLALERISRMIEDDPSPRQWSVSGMITEFRGENYLLITRSVIKPRLSSPTSNPEPSNSTPATKPTPPRDRAAAARTTTVAPQPAAPTVSQAEGGSG